MILVLSAAPLGCSPGGTTVTTSAPPEQTIEFAAPSGKDASIEEEACASSGRKAERAKVDVIFVIDTSGSMNEELLQIRANVNAFAQKIGRSGLDYRVIMLAAKGSVGSYQVCVPPPLAGPGCADNPPRFFHVNQVVESSDSLQKILSAYPLYKANLRREAYKVFVEVTDDDSYMPAASFDTALLALDDGLMFGTARERRYIFDSIVGWSKGGPTGAASTRCTTAVNPGLVYQTLSLLTGGVIASVCETDYSGVLDNVAVGVTKRLGCEFAMPQAKGNQIEDPNKVVVRYSAGKGKAKDLVRVTDKSKCGKNESAWYYDDNGKPTRIFLCEDACSSIGQDSQGKIEILVGCQAPPPR